MPTITWLGHNAWAIDTGEHKLLVDPFFDDSPTSPVKADEVEADYVLLSHGHGDHLGDTVAIAKRTGATVVTNYELSVWLTGQGVDAGHALGMNPGGGVDLPFGRVTMTVADHSSSLPDGAYAGVAMGIVVTLGEKRVYFACDTALFSDMRLIGAGGLDLAVLPIGDLFTMGPADSVEATRLLAPAKVAPCHYNTFPPIEQDAAAWAEAIRSKTDAEPIVLSPGEALEL
ncbi:MAG: metal-dependent hydrolase [Planctomycetota bacterium]